MTTPDEMNTVAALRALAPPQPQPLAGALLTAEHQAQALADLLRGTDPLIGQITQLLPVSIGYADDLPSTGISFWARHRWHIHIRPSDPIGVQNFSVLHEVKHIIDHPARTRHPHQFSHDEWEQLANHVAVHTLTRQAINTP